ncbi:MAG: hypothetical protein J6S65_03665 [Bacteroidaceae bacterium]|nr:hypothetical protein [Bacteroidaceae bacterium]MBO7660615.1 hypothetical protein [Bacteroidaceae bacterium]
MKKILFLAATILCAAFAATSCSKESKAEASLYYIGECAKLSYTDSTNAVFEKLILESLDNLGYTGSKSVFQEKAEVGVSNVGYAQYMCNVQAHNTYAAKLNKLTLSEVKNSIFSSHTDSIIGLGYSRADSIPLKTFTAQFNLLAPTFAYAQIDSFSIGVK